MKPFFHATLHKVLWYLHVALLSYVALILCNALDPDCYWCNLPEFPLSGRCVSLELLLGTNRSFGSTNLIQLNAGQLFCWISQNTRDRTHTWLSWCPASARLPSAPVGCWPCCTVGTCVVHCLEEQPVTSLSQHLGRSLGRCTKPMSGCHLQPSINQSLTWWKTWKAIFTNLFSFNIQHRGRGSNLVGNGPHFII